MIGLLYLDDFSASLTYILRTGLLIFKLLIMLEGNVIQWCLGSDCKRSALQKNFRVKSTPVGSMQFQTPLLTLLSLLQCILFIYWCHFNTEWCYLIHFLERKEHRRVLPCNTMVLNEHPLDSQVQF